MDIILNGISKTGLIPENNKETKMIMTNYEFEVKGYVKVTMDGRDTDDNYEKAKALAVIKAKNEIDEDWFSDAVAGEYETQLEPEDLEL
jgi:predicted 3-demethylubiquinone-9 3-methyltransferase (glyoxalase superfamily)